MPRAPAVVLLVFGRPIASLPRLTHRLMAGVVPPLGKPTMASPSPQGGVRRRHPQPHPTIPGSRGFADHLSPVSWQLYCVQPPTPLGPPSATLQLCASHPANQPPSASRSVFLSQFPRGRAWVLLTLLPDLDWRAGAIYQPPLRWWPRPARTQSSAAEVLLPKKTFTELKVSDHWLQYESFSSVIFFPELSIFMHFQICGSATKTVVQRIPANSLPRSHRRAQA